MGKFGLESTKIAMSMLERVMRSDINVTGLENLSGKPTLFVINHFTRAETFLVPYLLYKYSGEVARSLAYDGLFKGKLGDYLTSLGVLSTGRADRDNIIIGDLMTGRSNWVIYPEGVMVKSKQIIKRGKFMVTSPGRVGPPRTGGAILALKSELYRREYFRAVASRDEAKMKELEERFNFDGSEAITSDETQIIPITLTYYPLRPGQNVIKRIVTSFVKDPPARLLEELEVEGNMLLHRSDISMHLSPPINVGDYLGTTFSLTRKLVPFFRSIEKNNLLLKARGVKLTRDFMGRIYNNLQINIDHIVCSALAQCSRNDISVEDFNRAVYASAVSIRQNPDHRLHRSLTGDLFRILAPERYEAADSIMKLARDKGIISIKDGTITIHRVKLEMMHMFHNVRLQNPVIVIANEFEPLKEAMRTVAQNVNLGSDELRERAISALAQADHTIYTEDYKKYYEEDVSKAVNIGAPFLLRSTQSTIGIVLCHGLLSAPAEIREMAEYLRERGYNVYGVRLKGHGTAPRNLDEVDWEEWYPSYLRGITVLEQFCDKVVFGGFSTGGLLALLAAARHPEAVAAFAINPPISLGAIRARRALTVNLWNEMLDAINMEGASMRFIETDPEFSETNYNKVYIRVMGELDNLMDATKHDLKKIDMPTLIVKGTDDPTVAPSSSDRIYKSLRNPHKKMVEIKAKRHVIVRGEEKDDVFREVSQFLRPYTGICDIENAE
jgi:esterase/lipase/1-acyl-sn-glycerol-3-phosphate acyltransferase